MRRPGGHGRPRSGPGQPADPAGGVVTWASCQFYFEGSDDVADEPVVAMSRERIVREEQQTIVSAIDLRTCPVTAHEVRDVVGDNGTPVPGGESEQLAVVDATQMLTPRFLHSENVVPAGTKLLSDDPRDHLVQEKPHSSRAWETS